jgi:thiamine biosynthesis lipoprotein
MGGTGAMPEAVAVEEARARVGYRLVELDRASSTVRFGRPGVMLDLGAIGKGYAIEQAVDILREAGVTSAIVHGGTSTVYALGAPPGEPAWQVAIEHPPASDAAATPDSTGSWRWFRYGMKRCRCRRCGGDRSRPARGVMGT